MRMNEIICISLIVLTNVNKYDILNGRKESTNDRDGRTAHNRRCSPYTQIHRVLHPSKMQKWRAESYQNWWTLEDQTRRFTGLHRETVPATRQKIKPAHWLATTEFFMAANSPPKWLGPRVRSEPSNPLPMYMIHSRIAKCKTVLSNMGTR